MSLEARSSRASLRRQLEASLKKVVFLALFGIAAPLAFAQTDWPTFGHDDGGQRYSPLKQITPQNVNDLKVAWVYHMKPAGAPDIMPQQGFPGGGPPGGPPRPAPPAAGAPDNATAQARA
jgi:hypothetical protein